MNRVHAPGSEEGVALCGRRVRFFGPGERILGEDDDVEAVQVADCVNCCAIQDEDVGDEETEELDDWDDDVDEERTS